VNEHKSADRMNPHEKWLRKLAAELQSPNPPTTSCIVHTVLQAANEIGHLNTQLEAELKYRQDNCND
jgi:hypothetical protein